MARQSKKNNKSIVGMPCICGKDGNLKVSIRGQNGFVEGIQNKAAE